MSVFYGDRECVSRFVDLNDEWMALSDFGNTLPAWNKMKLALYIGSIGELFTFAPQALHNFFVKEDRQLIGVVGVILQPSVSLTVFGVLLLATGVMFIPSIVWRLHENYKLNK